jgi:hypothetical protein
MKIDPVISKFLHSKYGQEIVKAAYMQGQVIFKYGKVRYKVAELKHMVDSIKLSDIR